MKKAIVIIAVLLLVVWVISWFRTPEAVATSAAKPWPGDMGTLASVEKRFPPQHANAAAAKLTALMKALPTSAAADEFVAREIARGSIVIGTPPPLPQVEPIRDLLLSEPVVWERHVEIGNAEAMELRGLQMNAARSLIATALAHAHAGNPSAWEDLHAAWTLARSNDGHPLFSSQTAALSIARMINGVAWKMPLPAPAWLADLQQRDSVRPLLEAFQHAVASYSDDGAQLFPTKMLADSVEHDRLIAEQVFKETRCDVNLAANELGVDVASVWRRAFRYRAEREASANALRVREGKPIVTASQCSDGAWSFDGTVLRFSREIATAAPDRPLPLTLRLRP